MTDREICARSIFSRRVYAVWGCVEHIYWSVICFIISSLVIFSRCCGVLKNVLKMFIKTYKCHERERKKVIINECSGYKSNKSFGGFYDTLKRASKILHYYDITNWGYNENSCKFKKALYRIQKLKIFPFQGKPLCSVLMSPLDH